MRDTMWARETGVKTERRKDETGMSVILRWLLRIFSVAVIGLAIGAALAWYLVSRSLPDYGVELQLAGLDGEVRITRDANAVPHIRATTDQDAFYAMGLVHAQDRLWQMELNRRAAQGNLSSLLGERTIGVDRLVKTLDLYGLASRSLKFQTPETQAALAFLFEQRHAYGSKDVDLRLWADFGHVLFNVKEFIYIP